MKSGRHNLDILCYLLCYFNNKQRGQYFFKGITIKLIFLDIVLKQNIPPSKMADLVRQLEVLRTHNLKNVTLR